MVVGDCVTGTGRLLVCAATAEATELFAFGAAATACTRGAATCGKILVAAATALSEL